MLFLRGVHAFFLGQTEDTSTQKFKAYWLKPLVKPQQRITVSTREIVAMPKIESYFHIGDDGIFHSHLDRFW